MQRREEEMMAKFQLRETGWPIKGGRVFIPKGTIIDTVAGTDPWSPIVASLGLTPPVNAQPFDQGTYDLMRQEFPAYRIVTVPGADGINRT
jgi:hypothetical protein